MDSRKIESICSWIASTDEAKKALNPNNVIRVRDLSAHFTAVGSPFINTTANRQPPANRPPLHSDQTPKRTRNPRRRSSSRQIFEATRNPPLPPPVDHRACPSGLLVDVRTTSEIDRDEAEARARVTHQATSGHLPLTSPPSQARQIRVRDPILEDQSRQDNKPKRHRGRKRYRSNVMDFERVPPHLRARQPREGYVPPHLRNQKSRMNPTAVTDRDRGQPSQAFKAVQKKWANQDHTEPEGGVTLNRTIGSSNKVAHDEGITTNDGVALETREGTSSPVQTTTGATNPSAITTPPPTPASVPTVEQTQQTNGDDGVQNQPPTASPTVGGQRGSRKQKSSNGKPKRNEKWVTNKEIRERAQKNSAEPVGAWGSDAGFNSNPGGDPQHDIKKLVDWQGNWLPGPTDWESRRSYHHRNFNEEMMRFVNDSIDKEAAVDVYNEPTFLDNPSGEVTPRVWTSLHVEGTSLQEWWNNHVGSSLADPDSKAWWRSYISQDSGMLVPYDVPDASLDLDDHEGRILYLNDLGSGYACKKLMEKRNKRKADRERRQATERELTAAAAVTPPVEIEAPSKIKPAISLYVRPALAVDSHQLAGIYNHYISHSIRSPEIELVTAATLSQRIAAETSEGMPWLVACQKGRKGGRGYTNGTDASILGFACASDYHGRISMYGFTAEVEIYVHPNYLRQKVGSCLMDRLLYVLDPGHYPRSGYQFITNGPMSEPGGVRVIGSAIIHVPFDKKDPEDLKAVLIFLSKFGFKKEAELTNLGIKQAKNVSLAILRYYTGNTIDPRSAIVS